MIAYIGIFFGPVFIREISDQPANDGDIGYDCSGFVVHKIKFKMKFLLYKGAIECLHSPRIRPLQSIYKWK